MSFSLGPDEHLTLDATCYHSSGTCFGWHINLRKTSVPEPLVSFESPGLFVHYPAIREEGPLSVLTLAEETWEDLKVAMWCLNIHIEPELDKILARFPHRQDLKTAFMRAYEVQDAQMTAKNKAAKLLENARRRS